MKTKKVMCLLFFMPLLCLLLSRAVLQGNSLEEPLGELPTPFSANSVSEQRMEHMVRAQTQTHAQGIVTETKREESMRSCVTQQRIMFLSLFLFTNSRWTYFEAAHPLIIYPHVLPAVDTAL